jgi:hypothetical protein
MKSVKRTNNQSSITNLNHETYRQLKEPTGSHLQAVKEAQLAGSETRRGAYLLLRYNFYSDFSHLGKRRASYATSVLRILWYLE